MFNIIDKKLSAVWNDQEATSVVERHIEESLSPRAKETIAYMESHVGGFVKPTHKPLNRNVEEMNQEKRKELEKFDEKFAQRVRNTPPEMQLCTSM